MVYIADFWTPEAENGLTPAAELLAERQYGNTTGINVNKPGSAGAAHPADQQSRCDRGFPGAGESE